MIDINFVSPSGGFVKSVNGKTGKVVLTALDIAGVATQDYVIAKIAEAQLDGEEVDLSAYATKQYVADEIAKIDIPEVEVDLTDYYTKAEVDAKIPDVSGFTTMSAVEAKGYQTADDVNALIADALADFDGFSAPSAEGVEF